MRRRHLLMHFVVVVVQKGANPTIFDTFQLRAIHFGRPLVGNGSHDGIELRNASFGRVVGVNGNTVIRFVVFQKGCCPRHMIMMKVGVNDTRNGLGCVDGGTIISQNFSGTCYRFRRVNHHNPIVPFDQHHIGQGVANGNVNVGVGNMQNLLVVM